MSKLALRHWLLIGIVCLLFGGGGIVLAAPSAELGAAPKEAAASEGGDEAEAGEAAAGEEGEGSAPDLEAERKAAEDACKASIEGLRKNDAAALKATSDEERARLFAGSTGVSAVTCLAIANGDKSLCDLLSGDARKACLDHSDVGAALKGVAKEEIKGQLLFLSCSTGSSGPHCEVLRQAVNEGSAEKCQALEDPSYRAFCSAVATREAAKCSSIPDGAQRSYCEAYAADDPAKCASDSQDCIAMAKGFAALKKGGLESFRDIDATIAAPALGSKACDALVDKVLEVCSPPSTDD